MIMSNGAKTDILKEACDDIVVVCGDIRSIEKAQSIADKLQVDIINSCLKNTDSGSSDIKADIDCFGKLTNNNAGSIKSVNHKQTDSIQNNRINKRQKEACSKDIEHEVIKHNIENRLYIKVSSAGVSLCKDGMEMYADLTHMIKRLKKNNLSSELLVKAAKFSDKCKTALDATAGMAEDSLLLAAAGFEVVLYEKDPIIYILVKDSLERARNIPELSEAVSRMRLVNGDSIEAMRELRCDINDCADIEGEADSGNNKREMNIEGNAAKPPDIILLDPMFPERQKSGLVKKKFQLIHNLERPCSDEEAMMEAAMAARPQKIIIKRPLKGPYLAGIKPSYSLTGKSIRYDCIINIK